MRAARLVDRPLVVRPMVLVLERVILFVDVTCFLSFPFSFFEFFYDASSFLQGFLSVLSNGVKHFSSF